MQLFIYIFFLFETPLIKDITNHPHYSTHLIPHLLSFLSLTYIYIIIIFSRNSYIPFLFCLISFCFFFNSKSQSISILQPVHTFPFYLLSFVFLQFQTQLCNPCIPPSFFFFLPHQSAFIPGRWIVENQLIVQEILHSFKKRKVNSGFVAMKVDLQKVYDRVNWNFLKTVMQKFGFNGTFVNWIYECVSTVSSFVLINGGKSQWFQPSQGFRQGDPLSSYLFIIC